MITIQEITKLANLARIKLNDVEKKELQSDMEAILDYFKKLQAFETNSGDAAEYTDRFSATSNLNELREDKYLSEEGLFRDDLLKQAPEREKGYLKVKKIL